MSEHGEPLSFDRMYWEKGFYPFAGVDEAGRGALFGPVVAAAVVLSPDGRLSGFRDSKTISASRREELFEELKSAGHEFSVGVVDAEEIDRTDILRATLKAMKMACEGISAELKLVLVDGDRRPPLDTRVETIVGGDRLSLSIAAASIVAKVTRDGLVRELAERFPGYGLENNKGYGTKEHIAAVCENGPTPFHRKSFRPISGIGRELWR